MEKTLTLKDGREIVIRPLAPDDLERSFAFFSALPEEDRRYLRYDVTRRELVKHRIDDVAASRVLRLVAVADGAIVADGALELQGHGWGDNVGEIRLIVGRGFQRHGLGTLLARELYYLAAEHRLDRIVARMMRPQKGARAIFRRLGFREEFFIPEHVRDQKGEWQDLVIVRCNLDEMWHDIEERLADMDLGRGR